MLTLFTTLAIGLPVAYMAGIIWERDRGPRQSRRLHRAWRQERLDINPALRRRT